jgi:hypothetical protein
VRKVRVAELVLWPVALAAILVAVSAPLPLAPSTPATPHESAEPIAGSGADAAGIGRSLAASDRLDPGRVAALFAPPPRAPVAQGSSATTENASPAAPPEAAAWLRFVGTVRLDGNVMHYFADQRTGAVLRVQAEGEADWILEAVESTTWVLRNGTARYRVTAPRLSPEGG